MSCRVHHLNKKTGVSYVYESVSYWDKEKQQSRSKQVCIGKIDPVTGDLIPSRRLQPVAPMTTAAAAVQEKGPSIATAAIVGPTLILDALSKRLGLAKLLKSVFPEFHGQILTMAYYLAAHGGPLSQCASWTRTHD
ncbi:MAG: Transposase IS4 family protein, partial [candidate division WWE3 bacterium GW2011_GWA1_41_8]